MCVIWCVPFTGVRDEVQEADEDREEHPVQGKMKKHYRIVPKV